MSQTGLTIRNYIESDDQRLEEITKLAWVDVTLLKKISDTFGQRGGKPWWHYKITPLLAYAKSNPKQFLVAEQNGQVVGYAIYSTDTETRIGTVQDNAVDPSFGGRGIGSRLHERVLDEMKASGMEIAKVGTFEHQVPARKMYEKHGFKEVGRQIIYLRSL